MNERSQHPLRPEDFAVSPDSGEGAAQPTPASEEAVPEKTEAGCSKRAKTRKKRQKRQKQRPAWDDGRTIAPMDAPWMPWNRGPSGRPSDARPPKGLPPPPADGVPDEEEDASNADKGRMPASPRLSRAEKRAMIRGGFLAALPFLLFFLLLLLSLYFLAFLWLK